MYVCELLTKNSLNSIKELNTNRYEFNIHNEDFFQVYYTKGLLGKMLLRKNVYILKKNNKCIGYLWRSEDGGNHYHIHSLNIVKSECNEENLLKLISVFKYKNKACFMCKNNGYNIKLLESIGFKKKLGTFQMECALSNEEVFVTPRHIEFKTFQRGKDEEIRCFIQNEVFKNETRKPLTVKDIIFDQCQDYYFPKGTVFIKIQDKYIGYGQIIIDNSIPLIVNVGILKKYRNNGYGEVLIKYLLNIGREFNFNKVRIKVDWNNDSALNLYKKCGFKVLEEDYKMEIVI